jgi:N-acyl-phosphatidylethanolamine-hydrolysing phospholipase D
MSRHLQEHHYPGGGFRNPWPVDGERGLDAFLRWRFERLKHGPRRKPGRNAFPRARARIAYPTARPNELRMTWVGHSTFLIQIGGLNVLTDPHWSLRSSPFPWLGPARLVAPGIPFEALPPIHVVVISHDHYDHLDRRTVRRLADSHPAAQWLAPLGHARYLESLGVENAFDLDWWQSAELNKGALSIEALPVQHWTRRVGSQFNQRLWCSWSIQSGEHHVYFAGDSGYCPAFEEIAARSTPIDVAALPIGAYEPRWFMKPAHMNPEEALRAYRDLGAQHFVAMHWGTFMLTDEPALEPPKRIKTAWRAQKLPPEHLHVLAFGETLHLEACRP